MAKTAPLKNKNAPSKHSRAAKRASSPSINTDKSLKDVKPPIRHPVLVATTASGVKKSKGKVLSTKARKRQEKGMDRAEAVTDRTEKKIERSKGQARKILDRSKAWEETNKKVLAEKAAAKKAKDEKDQWDDEVEMADAAERTPASPASIPSASVDDPIEEVDLIL